MTQLSTNSPRHRARSSEDALEVRRLGVVDYRDAYTLQHELAADRAEGRLDHDVLLLLEHPSIFTAGKRTEDSDRPTNGAEVIDVDRGGRITWHGPGQLVGYPIIALAQPLDVVDYVRRIESALIAVSADVGVRTVRVEGRSGVWVCDDTGDRKLGQIGIRVARGIALHGFALNVNPDLSAFESIIPCGIADAGVTSLSLESGREIIVDDIIDPVAEAVADALDHRTDTADAESATARVASVR
ncbi:MAG: lipoyl(octanoyl) transferase LipB [Gordonia sp. (in: high G+C Gram-positive bacteria)]